MVTSGARIFLVSLADIKAAASYYGPIALLLGVYYLVLSYVGYSIDTLFFLVGILLLLVIILFSAVYRLNNKVDKQAINEVNSINIRPRELFSQRLYLIRRNDNPDDNRFHLNTDAQQWYSLRLFGKGKVILEFKRKEGYPIEFYMISRAEYELGNISKYHPARTPSGLHEIVVNGAYEKYFGVVNYEDEYSDYEIQITSTDDISCEVNPIPFLKKKEQ